MSSTAAGLFDVSAVSQSEIGLAIAALGLSSQDLSSDAKRAVVVKLAFILQTATKVQQLCKELGILISDKSVFQIATTLRVDASAEFPKGNPLSASDRQIAEELVYQFLKATLPPDRSADLRSEAKSRVAFGERGRTTLHWIGQNILGFGR